MGINMPKFVTEKYNSFKETCYNVREGWRATKMVFKLARKLDISNASGTPDPDEILDTLKQTEDIPESFKTMLSSLNSDTLRALLKATMDTFSQKKNPTEPAQAQETVSKMADILYESKREEEFNNSKAVIDRMASAAEEQSKYESENMDHIDASSSQNTTHGSTPQDTNDTTEKKSQPGSSSKSEGNDDNDFIPSRMQQDILGKNKTNSHSSSNQTSNESEKDFSGTKTFRTAREFQDFTKRTFQKDKENNSNSDPKTRNLPPLTKMLSEELHKKFGADWRTHVPTFLKDPNLGPVPDLGLGLSREGNKEMVKQMSNVMKNLV